MAVAEEKGNLELDRNQVKKAAQCLLAYLKKTSAKETLLLNEGQPVSLLFTFWMIPKKKQTIRIPLPHAIRTDTADVCLFTRNEPNMTCDQTERFYKNLLKEKGITGVTQVMPLKVLKTEYNSYESKQKLLRNFDLFLTDARIRHVVLPLIGKHFFDRKKVPLPVNLMSEETANSIEQLIKGTVFTVTKKGSCCMVRVAHSEMTADQIVENIMAAVNTIAHALPQKGLDIKIIHMKSLSSAALPIYTSDLSHLSLLKEAEDALALQKRTGKNKSKKATKRKTEATGKEELAEEEEEIPQLIPIEFPDKMTKSEVPPESKQEKVTTVPLKRSKSSRASEEEELSEEKPNIVSGEGMKLKTPVKGKTSPERKKLVKSVKKAPKTPKQKLRRKVPQSC